jgi:ATP-dependent Clp protease ATP-binding subunit ClpA
MSSKTGNINIRTLLDGAQRLAEQHGHEFITLEHLLLAIVALDEALPVLEAHSATPDAMIDVLTAHLNTALIPVTHTQPVCTRLVQNVVETAVMISLLTARPQPDIHDVLTQILLCPAEDNFAVCLLRKFGFSALSIKNFVQYGRIDHSAMEDGVDHTRPGRSGTAESGASEDAKAVLAKYTRNLNEAAKSSTIDPLIGRETEVAAIVQITARRTKNNVVLVGDPGVGKTAIAEGLALKIVRGEVPDVLKDATVYGLDIGNLVAGTKYRGDFEERMKKVLAALQEIPGAIIFIDEIHTIMGAGAGSQSSLDVANLLKPALAKGSLRCIGATTLEEFRKHFEKDKALIRRFKRVDVDEPSIEDAKRILRGLTAAYGAYHGIAYTDAAVDAAVELSARYITGAKLPDKAIDLIDNAGATVRVMPAEERPSEIDADLIRVEVAKVTKIPDVAVEKNEGEKLRELGNQLKSQVYGQDEAVEAVVRAVRVARAGLREPNKPLGSYLFVGPTGVGKTEVAKQLAASLGVPLKRYDMSEYMEKHTVSRLIGAPPGYVGHGEGGAGSGMLVNDIDAHPHCVLLLDEIEKAHPDVFNVLLQVMDDGRLTAASGKTVDFRNVVVIMTSNAGAKEAGRKAIGFSNSVSSASEEKIEETFAPEFRNRLDAIVRFKPLSPDGVARVVDKFIAGLADMASRRGVVLKMTDAARSLIAAKGYDPVMGARPIARVINENIKVPLSEMMLFGTLENGGEATIDDVDGTIQVIA